MNRWINGRTTNPLDFIDMQRAKPTGKLLKVKTRGQNHGVRTTDVLAVRQSTKSSKGRELWHLAEEGV